ncbi:antirestriction protein ArdA [Propionispora hippei]|uniref:Antirestriction protein (ArdA) n=1 Tax=Propionispora hippei DSM 15287 TaxID=1123003 RepID=A0A1M6ME85_9FIRM|nr:antirestriction protein ArdA [Propionispora hippei]SHJ81757.1 Antirestriction protein (ArdA) [Propionispora hippei DSM 15287]
MLKIALTNLGKYNEGELVYKWLELPATEDEIEEAKEAIGINEQYEEWFITDYETDIEGLQVGEYEDLEALNELAERYENLHEYDQDIVQAIIEGEGYDLEEALDVLESGNYSFYPDVTNEEDLGFYVVDEGLFGVEIPDSLQVYIDHESIGRDWRINGAGSFTSKGYIELH